MIHIKEKIKCLNVLLEIKINEKPLKFVSLPNQFMKNLYLVNDIISDKEISEIKGNKDEVIIDFDFPAWLTESKLPFKKFNNRTTYKMSYDIEKIKFIRNEIGSLFEHEKDKARVIGRYIMRRGRTLEAFKKQYVRLA